MKINLGDKGHVLTHEDSVKGGKAISLYKTLSRTLNARKKCSTSCAFFEKCPVNALSIGFHDANHPEKDQQCMMKEFPATVRQQFIDMFLTGEEGMIQAIKRAMHNYMNDVDAYGTLRDKRDMIQLLLVFYDKVYNNTKRSAVKKEPLTITLRRVGIEPQTITVRPHVALPDGVRPKAEDLTSPANGDITEDDPESLVHSPILERVLRPVNRPVPGVITVEELKIETNIETIMEETEEDNE